MVATEKQMIEWAKKNPQFKKYSENISLVKVFYQKYNLAEKISDCIHGQKADLKLLVVSEEPRGPVRLCNDCKHKNCECGKNNFVYRDQKAYLAGDDSSVIIIDISPFYKGQIKELVLGETYRVIGKVKEYRDRLYITAEEISSEILPDHDTMRDHE